MATKTRSELFLELKQTQGWSPLEKVFHKTRIFQKEFEFDELICRIIWNLHDGICKPKETPDIDNLENAAGAEIVHDKEKMNEFA